jgi:hypothetical protein
MHKRTNDQRADRAFKALQAYKAAENETLGPDIGEDITDLLTDLHHYCQREMCRGKDEAMSSMDHLLISAQGHFEDEAT